jgi:hypothetical protein
MPDFGWWILLGVVAVAAGAALAWRPLRAAAREARFTQAKRDFHKQREWLEAKLIRLASTHVKPDSPRWADCDFDDAVAYVRHRATGELSALVGITVAMERIGHSPASASDLISNLRAGTAVFRFDAGHWETDGKVLLNLSPSEAIRFYQNDLEIVGQELAERPA